MSRFEGPQGIVTNGLVLNLDAGDPDSYTRSQPPYVEVLVVAGGGGTGFDVGGGGGAGGVIYNSAYQITNAAAITVTIGAGGGSGQTLTVRGTNGNNSVFGSLTAIGGGGGGAYNSAATAPGLDGGSGGGGGNYQSAAGGNGTPGQGFNGGSSAASFWGSGAGGGAGGPGANGIANQTVAGGAYATYAISGQSANYAGGGFGAFDSQTLRPSGQDSNGNTLGTYGFGANGTGSPNNSPYSGNQGIVIVRYPGLPAATGGTITYLNGYTIHTFTSSGTFTPYQWYDSSNIAISGTLTNGPTFVPQIVGGYFQNDGVDDYTLFTAPIGSATTVSVEMWCEIPSNYSNEMYFGWNGYDVWCSGGNLGYNTNNGDVYGISAATVSSLGLVNNWKHYVFEMRSDVSYTNNKIYINGVAQTLSQQASSESAGSRNFNNGVGQFPGYRSSPTNYVMASKVGSFRVYTRALSVAEVTQNFNAQRARFGI
jgi:hypothetical protein